MAVKTYSAKDVTIIFNGIPISGFADGTFMVAARDNPAFTSGSGADGEGWRAKSSDKTGTITLTLLQTSASNDLLSSLALLDESTGNGVGPFLAKDGSGRTLISAQTAWIEKQADSEFARDASDREWVLKTDSLSTLVGGN